MGIFLLPALLLAQEPEPIKIKVIIDNSSIKATPEIGGKTLANVSLDTVLESEEKQGEWYKVSVDKEGLRIAGFIHEMLVEVVTEEKVAEEEESPEKMEKTQAEIIAEIQVRLEYGQELIRQEKDYEKISFDLVNGLFVCCGNGFWWSW